MSRKYTILMTLMGLEIGGAETHVVELSKELKKMGYKIIVASNGGVYEKELREYGIIHYRVPMNQRNVFKMVKILTIEYNWNDYIDWNIIHWTLLFMTFNLYVNKMEVLMQYLIFK